MYSWRPPFIPKDRRLTFALLRLADIKAERETVEQVSKAPEVTFDEIDGFLSEAKTAKREKEAKIQAERIMAQKSKKRRFTDDGLPI